MRIGRELSKSVGEILMKVKLRMGNLSVAISEGDRDEFEETLRIVDVAADDIRRFSELLDPLEFKQLKLDGALARATSKWIHGLPGALQVRKAIR